MRNGENKKSDVILFVIGGNLVKFCFNLALELREQSGFQSVFLISESIDIAILNKLIREKIPIITFGDLHYRKGCHFDTIIEFLVNKKLIDLDSITWYEKEIINRGLSNLKLSTVHRKACEGMFNFEQIVRALHPWAVFLWNGLTLPTKAYSYVCKFYNTPVYYCERGYFPKSLVVDKKGVNYGGLLKETVEWKQYCNLFVQGEDTILEHYLNEMSSKGMSVVEQPKPINPHQLLQQYGISQEKKIILFPLQIDVDTNITYYSPYFKTNRDIIVILQEFVSRHKDFHVIVKSHPEEKGEWINNLKNKKGMTIVYKTNLYSLIKIARVIIVRNSTVGLEALCQRKPVVVLGQAIYGKKGFTYDVTSKNDVERQILRAASEGILKGESLIRARAFLFYLLKDYLYTFQDNAQFKEGNQTIVQNIMKNIAPISYNREYLTKPINKIQKKIKDIVNNYQIQKKKYREIASVNYANNACNYLKNKKYFDFIKEAVKSFRFNPRLPSFGGIIKLIKIWAKTQKD